MPWPAVASLVEPTVLTVGDDAIRDGMRFCYRRMKLVIEPAAATGIAALLTGQADRMGPDVKRIGVVLCGGNVSDDYINIR